MTYVVPPPPADPKPRMARVTDPEIIKELQLEHAQFRSPVGAGSGAEAFAEDHSLRQFRGLPVEFVP